MLVGIDHLVIAVVDPDAAAAELDARLGLAAGAGGRHEALGTFNRLVWLGDTYLELIGVFDPRLAAGSWVGAPTLRALERGGGLATVALATDDIETDAASLRSRGSDLAEPMAGERTRPDGRVVRWRLSAPRTLDPDRPPFLIEHNPMSAEWTGDDRAERALGPARLRVLELAVDDVNKTSQAWLRTAGLRFRPSLAGGGGRDADVGSQTLRLRPRRRRPAAVPPTVPAEPTVHLSIRGASPIDLDALGLHWRVGPSPDPA
jgi:Glyoxalase-like domain